MLFVVEGTDGSGKTTLAKALAEALSRTRHRRLVHRHFGPPEQHPLTEYESWLDFYRPGSGDHVVCDRFHWGEMIYGELYRGGSPLGECGWWHVEQYLRSRGALMILADGDQQVIEARQRALDEDFLQPEHASQVQLAFRLRHLQSGQFVFVYDSTRVAVDEAVTELLEMAAAAESGARLLDGFPSYVGGPRPRLLIVGDQPRDNPQESRRHEATFPPYPATSGRFLIEGLQRVGACWDVGITNAYHHGIVPIDLWSLWGVLGQPEVCALGRNADHHLSVMGVPHRYAHHPQYERRFHYTEQEDYARQVLYGFER